MSWSKSRVPSAHIGRRPRAVVVTGASSGIGRASAMKLARSGFRVFAGVRKEEDAEVLEEAAPDLIESPGFDDPREPERWDPALKLVEEILLTREPEVAEFPPTFRFFTRLAAHSEALSRRGTTVLHYRF